MKQEIIRRPRVAGEAQGRARRGGGNLIQEDGIMPSPVYYMDLRVTPKDTNAKRFARLLEAVDCQGGNVIQ